MSALIPGRDTPARPELGHPNGVQLGGLGTGRIELMSSGRPGIVAITHSPQRIVGPWRGTFFTLRAGNTFRLLQKGDQGDFRGVEAVEYRGRHPVADCRYSINDLPVEVSLCAHAPLIPHDYKRSTLPGAVFSFTLCNRGQTALPVELGFSWENVLGVGASGYRGESLVCRRSGTTIQPMRLDNGAGALRCTLPKPPVGEELNHWGETVLAALAPNGFTIAAYPFWNVLYDESMLLNALSTGSLEECFDASDIDSCIAAYNSKKTKPPSWDDPDPRYGGGRTGVEGMIHPAGVLTVRGTLLPGQTTEIPFCVSWHLPHHITRDGRDHGCACTAHGDAATVAQTLLDNRVTDRAAACALGDHLSQSSLPHWLVDKLCNDTTPLSTNSIVTADNTLYTLEATPMMWGATGTLDQRLVSHPGTSLFFPELDRSELNTFALLQADNGRIMHFNGNTHDALYSSAVDYGDPGWPDLAMSFIVQVWRSYTENGDDEYRTRNWPHVERAYHWLCAADHDGDGVPEGGSSWDVEHYPGCFIATATLWLAVLRILQAAAVRFELDEAQRIDLDQRFDTASSTVQRMWNGSYYRKYLTTDGSGSDDCFIGQLEGEWVVRQLGLQPILPVEQVRMAAESCYRLNVNPQRYCLAPIQVLSDGTLAQRKYAWHAWPQYTLTFLDCVALYTGAGEAALANIARFDRVVRETIKAPWATTLWHDARTGLPDFAFYGLDWYMNGPAIWWALSALSGFTNDAAAKRLIVGPYIEAGKKQITYPLICPLFWGAMIIDIRDDTILIKIRLDRMFNGSRIEVRSIRWRGNLTMAEVLVSGRSVSAALQAAGAYADISLAEPVMLDEKGSVDLVLRS